MRRWWREAARVAARHCERSEAIRSVARALLRMRSHGLLRCARNDGELFAPPSASSHDRSAPARRSGAAQPRAASRRRRAECCGCRHSAVRIELAKSLDQIGLAVEIDRVPAGFRLHLVDPDRAAALALGREIARLPPFQRFFQRCRRPWWFSRCRRSAGAAPAIWLSPAWDKRRRRLRLRTRGHPHASCGKRLSVVFSPSQPVRVIR